MNLLALCRPCKLPVPVLEWVSPGVIADCNDVNVTDITSQRSTSFKLRHHGCLCLWVTLDKLFVCSLPQCPPAGAEMQCTSS